MRGANGFWRLFLTVSAIFFFSVIYSAIALYSINSTQISFDLDPVRNLPKAQILHPKSLEAFQSSDQVVVVEKSQKKTQDLTNNYMKFHQIDAQNSHAFIAVADHRNGNMGYPCVRILMVIPFATPYRCRFHDNSTVDGSLYEFSENHQKTMKTFYLNCKLPQHLKLDDIENVIVIQTTTQYNTTVPISYRIQPETTYKTFKNDFSLCVPFLFGGRYTKKGFVGFMELSKLLGVDQVTLYADRSTLNANLTMSMDLYAENGFLEVIEFKLPFDEKLIWYHGQLLTITDCLLRQTGRSKYVSFHDLDEYLVPQNGKKDTKEILSQWFANEKVGSIRIPTYYFNPTNDTEPITLNNLDRSIYPDKRLTKCVVRPEYVFEQGIHHTSRVIQDNFLIKTPDTEDIVLFHYKKTIMKTKVDDFFQNQYGNDFLRNYYKQLYK